MISVSLLHPHNPLLFVASTNFLSCMYTPASPSPSLSVLSIAHIRYFSLGRSPTVFAGLPSPFFPAHTDRYTSLARSAYHKHTLSLFSSHHPCLPVSNTVPHTCTLSPLFSSISHSHTPSPLDIVGLSHHLLAAYLSPSLSVSPSLIRL